MVEIPACAWQRPLGQGWENPYRVRYASNLDDGPWHGMPLGGFGAGCFGRSPAGDFNLWHIDGGEHCFETIPACQFSVFEASPTGKQAYSLGSSPKQGLGAWQWYPKEQGSYHALYPRSWFDYTGVFQAQITCEQFSPILPHNYQETSYPVAIFLWTVHNPTAQPLTLSIMLTWQNLVGWFTNANKSPQVQIRDDGSPVYDYQPRWGQSQGNFNQIVCTETALGWVLKGDRPMPDQVAEGEGEWAILTERLPQREIFYHRHWNPVGDGAELWNSFAVDGSLQNIENFQPAGSQEQVAAALAVRITLEPRETQAIPFTVAWDFPVTEFAEGIIYHRRYTDFYDRSGTNAVAIAQDGLKHYADWYSQIQAWQAPILERSDWPDGFKMALCNELYDLTSGGSLWSSATEADPRGQFAVLECLDYRWYESLDVRLYGSFALLMLWPDLEKAVMRAFARSIPKSDPHQRIIGYFYRGDPETAHRAPRKLENAVPHDLGGPNEHPWQETNYTAYQDCNLWKDLASDFVLLVYRDFLFTGPQDIGFLKDCWPAIVRAIAYLKTFDTDNDGLPENSGAPDQTYDDWQLKGISAYCGGLWIAALEAAVAIAHILEASGETIPEKVLYQTWLHRARPLYHQTLWTGEYYRLDSESGSQVVMADQLCGQFYARLLNLPDVVPQDSTLTALKTIYDVCFVGFHGGKFGVANGLLPDSRPEKPNATHPLEVWTGINFGLAAFYWQMGLRAEAWKITETVIQQIYEHGLQFRTPEAITAEGTFRACMYLRPMAIWALAWVTGYPETKDVNA